MLGDWKQIFILFACLALVVLAIWWPLWRLQVAAERHREERWHSAIAGIEDVRTKLVGQFDSKSGGYMVYDVQILAAFQVDGSRREQWVSLSQASKRLEIAEYDEAQWLGKQCIVRWDPSNPQLMVVESY